MFLLPESQKSIFIFSFLASCVIFGASSFAGSFEDLKAYVGSIELYIPKLGIYSGSNLEAEKLGIILDEISSYNFETTIHAPYCAADSKYPQELQVNTAQMEKRDFLLMEQSIALANRLGSRVVVVHPGRVGPDREKSFHSMIENLSSLSLMAEEYGIFLGLENKEGTDLSNFCCTANELVKTIEAVNCEHLKATFDIGHANLTCGGNSESLKAFVETLKEYIIHIHLHDNSGKWTEKYDGDEHKAPGKGSVDFSVLNLLSGYKGIYNFEVFSLEDLDFGKKILKKALNFE